jgi:hypothetical protein
VVVVEFIFQWFQNIRLLFPNPRGRFGGNCVIILVLANEGCVIVGFLLALSVCCRRSHRVARG